MTRPLFYALAIATVLCLQNSAHAQAEALPAFEQWVDHLCSGTRSQKMKAAVRLGRSQDDRAIEHLAAAVMEPDRTVARVAIMALGMHGSAQAAEALSAVTQFTDVSLRMLAINGLGSLGRPEGIEALGRAIQDSDARVRNCAAAALGNIRSPKAAKLLMAGVEDADRNVRSAVIMALGQSKDKATADFLQQLATGGREDLRAEALVVLTENPDLLRRVKAEELLESASPDGKRAVALALAKAPDARPETLALAAKHARDADARTAVAVAQVDREYRALMKQLRKESADEIEKVHRRIKEGNLKTILDLAKTPSPAAVCVLAEVCEQDLDSRQWQMALHALVRMSSEPARLVIRAQLARSLPRPSGNLLNAVGLAKDPKSVSLLLSVLQCEHPATRWLAVQALGFIGSDDAVPALVGLLADQDKHARESAVLSLASIGGQAVTTALTAKWEGADDSLRRTIVSALAATESTAAVVALRALLPKSGKLQGEVEKVLAECGKIACERNLKAIWNALDQYAKKHRDELPKRLDELVPKFLPERQLLVCPGDELAARAHPRSSFSYMYPVSSKGKVGETVPIVCDIEPSSHGDEGRNVLFLDGTVKWLPEEDFWQLMETITELPQEE